MIDVDISELEVDYTAENNSLTTEYWGNIKTDRWIDIYIESITWQGYDVELSDADYDKLIEHIQENLE